MEEVITSPNSPIVQFAATPTNGNLRRETGSKFVYQRSDYLSKQSRSEIRHDADYMRSYVGKLGPISSLKNTWQQSRGAIQHNTNPVLTQPQKRRIQGR